MLSAAAVADGGGDSGGDGGGSGGESEGGWSSGATDEASREISKALNDEDYDRAIELLLAQNSDQPANADTLNLLGFSHRKLNRTEQAMTYYRAALDVDPKHRGAHEYLGELYLQLGDLDQAEAQLRRLDELCFFTCAEMRKLKKAIRNYKKKSS
jgi:tetratricopeptide (TPR) repeat protein